MKKVIPAIMILFSLTSFAQIVDIDVSVYEGMVKLVKAHNESVGVSKIREEIEQKYKVKCEDRNIVIFPAVSNRVTYRGKCGKVSLKIRSSFSYSNDDYSFQVRTYKVTLNGFEP